jgi:formamidopyrimidine-DNA glycosylase
MPELPEVTTTVNGLQRVLPGLTISTVWTDLAKDTVKRRDFENTLKSKAFFTYFQKEVADAKVLNVERRAKNILINLSSGKTILIHMKMTGHLIYGDYVYNKKENTWLPHPDEREALHDPFNRFVHVVFNFAPTTPPSRAPLLGQEGKQLVFCDTRKFGKITLLDTKTAHETEHLKYIGPEPLDESFNFENFKNALIRKNKLNTVIESNKPIKTILMDQAVIAGIGNIYSDEMLWLAGIHPESRVAQVPLPQLKLLFKSMKEVLKKGINFGGDSLSDYRDIDGKRGDFQNHHNVYQRTKEKCGKRGCSGVILRKVIGGRSAHFCDTHQIKY